MRDIRVNIHDTKERHTKETLTNRRFREIWSLNSKTLKLLFCMNGKVHLIQE